MYNSMLIQAEIHRQNLMEEADHVRLMREAKKGQVSFFRLPVPMFLKRRSLVQVSAAPQLDVVSCIEGC